ncbi:MAG: hypothetical protein HY257_02335 [Chloroflexi bacterium]|nr:hypothetical protein [Chloroflexota bacterium]
MKYTLSLQVLFLLAVIVIVMALTGCAVPVQQQTVAPKTVAPASVALPAPPQTVAPKTVAPTSAPPLLARCSTDGEKQGDCKVVTSCVVTGAKGVCIEFAQENQKERIFFFWPNQKQSTAPKKLSFTSFPVQNLTPPSNVAYYRNLLNFTVMDQNGKTTIVFDPPLQVIAQLNKQDLAPQNKNFANLQLYLYETTWVPLKTFKCGLDCCTICQGEQDVPRLAEIPKLSGTHVAFGD